MTTNEILARKMVEDNKASGMVGSDYEGYLKALNRVERESGPLNNGAVPDSTTNPNWLSDYNAPIIARENRTENGQKIPTSTVLSGEAPPIDGKTAEDEGGILSGLRSFTRPIGNYARDLFNDPARMALITGGLQARESGFLDGIDTGIKTHRTLSKPINLGFKRQEEIKQANAMALLQEKNRLGLGTGMGEYRRVLQQLRALEQQNPKHPDIPYLKKKLESMTRLDPSSRGKDYQLLNHIRTTYGEDSPQMKDFLAVGPKGFNMNFGDTQKIIDPSGREIYSGKNNPKPEAEPEFLAKQIKAKELATQGITAQIDLPSALRSRDRMIENIDSVMNHPNLNRALGMIDSNVNLDWYNADIQARIKQIVGQNFMTAYKGLKGGGPITDIEGNKAQSALARMDQAQSPEDYKSALLDLKAIVLEAYEDTLEKSRLSVSPKRREGDSKSRRSTDKITEEERRELEALKLELGKQ
jgi:hypothetical protein